MSNLISLDQRVAEAPQINIEELSHKWLDFIDVEKASSEAYAKAIRQFIYFLTDKGIKKPIREDIKIYKEQLVGLEYKTTTIQLYLQAVKLFFKWTEAEGIYPNIALNIKSTKPDHAHKKDFLSGKQANTLISDIDTKTLQGKRDYAIITLMLTSGLRTIEVQRANVEDLRPLGDYTVLYIQGKGHTERADYVKVVDEVKAALMDYFKARRDAGGLVKARDPLFISVANKNFGERMTTRSISRIAKEHLKEAGFDSPRLTAHSLRHTAATLNLLNGASLEETQQLLRHTSVNTTMIYSHAIDRLKNNSEFGIAGVIFDDTNKDKEQE